MAVMTCRHRKSFKVSAQSKKNNLCRSLRSAIRSEMTTRRKRLGAGASGFSTLCWRHGCRDVARFVTIPAEARGVIPIDSARSPVHEGIKRLSEMKNLFEQETVDQVISRIEKLEPASPRQ